FKDQSFLSFFFSSAQATPAIYPLSLHDALPISGIGSANAEADVCISGLLVRSLLHGDHALSFKVAGAAVSFRNAEWKRLHRRLRSEEHTSELQSRRDLVCRLLLEKKNK